MVTLFVLVLVAYVLAKIGIFLIGPFEVEEQDISSKDRMIQYSAWLKGNGRKIIRGCVDDMHSPMVLFNQKDSTKVDAVICKFCTDTLPMPASYSCDKCWIVAVDGYLHVDECDRHKKEPVLT